MRMMIIAMLIMWFLIMIIKFKKYPLYLYNSGAKNDRRKSGGTLRQKETKKRKRRKREKREKKQRNIEKQRDKKKKRGEKERKKREREKKRE